MTQGRRQRKRIALHQSLLDTAAELFAERGVARTTVDDIAEAADVARTTVFNHFPYKEAIVLELSADAVQNAAHKAQALLAAGTPAIRVLECILEWVLDAAIEEGELAVVMAQELLHHDPERAARAAQQVPLREIVEAILVQAREEGSIREDLPLDVVAQRVSDSMRCVLQQVTARPAQQLKRELAVCLDMVFNGIRDRRRT
ncbi:MAG TPA: helix-turn-helix domain-containing protein [Chloroflexota bacterium]|nr:helix-turn-helix domain-containing protein [Chloroflexota bacterium]